MARTALDVFKLMYHTAAYINLVFSVPEATRHDRKMR